MAVSLGKGSLGVSVLLSAFLHSTTSPAAEPDCPALYKEQQVLRRQGKMLESVQVLSNCARTCSGVIRDDCVQTMAQVSTKVPSIAIRARSAAGTDLISVRVTIDGKAVLNRLDGRSIQLDPGAHVVRGTLESGESVEQEVLVVEGEKDRIVLLTFPDRTLGDAGMASPPVDSGISPSKSSGVPWVTWVLAGVGVASLGIFTWSELSGQSDYRALRDGCGQTGSCSSSDVNSAKARLYYVAPISLGLGIGTLGTAAWLFFSNRNSDSSRGAFDFRVAPGGGFVGYQGRF